MGQARRWAGRMIPPRDFDMLEPYDFRERQPVLLWHRNVEGVPVAIPCAIWVIDRRRVPARMYITGEQFGFWTAMNATEKDSVWITPMPGAVP